VIVEMVASRQTRGFPVDDTAGKWPHNLSEEEEGKMRNWVRTNHQKPTLTKWVRGKHQKPTLRLSRLLDWQELKTLEVLLAP
jgi:hypothetical protein